MSRSAGKTVGKVIACILVLLVIAGIAGVIVRFTDGFTSEFKTFYVTVEGKDVLTNAGGYRVTPDKPLHVDVKYAFGSAGDGSGYTVKVIPHAVEGKDFDFALNGEVYAFQAEDDLTAGFEIERKETSFTITPKGGVTEVLRAVYPNHTVSDCRGKGYADMYALIVTSYNGKEYVTLYFAAWESVSGVTLDRTEILF